MSTDNYTSTEAEFEQQKLLVGQLRAKLFVSVNALIMADGHRKKAALHNICVAENLAYALAVKVARQGQDLR